MSGLRQNGHFLVFSGYLKKVSLGHVKVDFFGQIWSGTLIWYSDKNKDRLVSI